MSINVHDGDGLGWGELLCVDFYDFGGEFDGVFGCAAAYYFRLVDMTGFVCCDFL